MAQGNITGVPDIAQGAVLQASEPVPEGVEKVKGVDFNAFKDRDITAAELVDNMASMGFQATSVGEAARIINEMVSPLSLSPLRSWNSHCCRFFLL